MTAARIVARKTTLVPNVPHPKPPSLGYDVADRLATITPPTGQNAIAFTYHGLDRLATVRGKALYCGLGLVKLPMLNGATDSIANHFLADEALVFLHSNAKKLFKCHIARAGGIGTPVRLRSPASVVDLPPSYQSTSAIIASKLTGTHQLLAFMIDGRPQPRSGRCASRGTMDSTVHPDDGLCPCPPTDPLAG